MAGLVTWGWGEEGGQGQDLRASGQGGLGLHGHAKGTKAISNGRVSHLVIRGRRGGRGRGRGRGQRLKVYDWPTGGHGPGAQGASR